MPIFTRDPVNGPPSGGPGDGASYRVGHRRPAMLPPLDFRLERQGSAVRPFVIERPRYAAATGISDATRYQLFWVESLTQTPAGIEAALRRAEALASIERTYIGDQKLNGPLLTDAKYATGYFLCRAVNDEGDQSERILVASPLLNSILDSGLAGPVTYLQVSESGQQHQDTVFSLLAFTYIAPRPKRSFRGIVPVLRHYPNLNDLTYFGLLEYEGVSGGAGGGLLRIPQARRVGPGTITIAGAAVTGLGTEFTLIAQGKDYLEVFGHKQEIQSVNNSGSITLKFAWTGPAVAGVSTWAILGWCQAYALSQSMGGTSQLDDTTPFVSLVLDGDLGAPNAPAALTLVPFGNGIRGQFVQVAGVGIKGYIVKRSTGSADTPTAATEIIDPLKHDPTTPNGGTVLQFEDTKFTAYERENGQVFRYYVWTVNARDEISAAYATATASCRLDAGSDNGPQVPSRETPLSLCWNGMLWNTAAVTVQAADANQDGKMGVAKPAHVFRWDHFESGLATPAGFQNGNEVILPAPGGVGTYVGIQQKILAWDAAANGKIPDGALVGVQVKLRESGGGADGIFGIDISQLNAAGAHQGFAKYRSRLANDTISEVAGAYQADPADLTTDHRLFWAIFRLDTALTTDHVLVRIYWQNGSGAANLNIAEVMVWLGETLTHYTPQMADTNITYPAPTGPIPPPGFEDGDGSGRGVIDLQAP